MNANYRTLIPALVAIVCLIVASITHQAISANIQSNITNLLLIAIFAGTSIFGIIKNHFNAPPAPVQLPVVQPQVPIITDTNEGGKG